MPKLLASKYNPSLLLLIYIKDSLLQLRLHYHYACDWTLSKAQLYVQVSCDIEEIEPHHCGQNGLSMKYTFNNKCKRPAADLLVINWCTAAVVGGCEAVLTDTSCAVVCESSCSNVRCFVVILDPHYTTIVRVKYYYK